jgi:hypothetical protein
MLAGMSGFFLIFFLTVCLLVLAFEIVMFLDVIRNKKLTDTEKLLWGGGMFFFHPVIAFVYYFVVYSKKK